MTPFPARLLALLALLLSIASPAGSARAAAADYDVVVYGATSAGIAAAVQVKRMGKSVVVVGPDRHLGGLSSGGLGWTDSGNKAVIGGVSREFYQRVRAYYDDAETWRWQDPGDYDRYREGESEQWTFEPHIAERVFEDLVRDYEIPVVRDSWLDRAPGAGVVVEGGAIREVKMLSGDSFRGRVFLDATYEGDLVAAAGVSFTVGRESNDQYGETLNGVQIENATKHQFEGNIDPYVVPGDPSSGLLPRIHDGDPGEQGSADHRVQAYCFRVCLTRVPENRVPFPKPEGYDASQYELLLRTLQAGSWHIAGKFDMLPNLKTDTNNHGSFSTDNIGMNYDYPEATYERRREIIREHELYQKGYFWFIANDPRVPEDKREWMAKWGLAKDEFTDSGNWPHQIYVREARRMVSDFVMNENHLTGKLETPRPVGMGSYNMDSHNTQRYVDADGFARNEGDVQVSPGGPYPIDFGAIVPKPDECTNLLVPVCLSSSHIAYGSIRMEPVFMILGQSAATAACLAIDADQPVQQVPYAVLRERLLADGQVLEFRRQNQSRGSAVDRKNLQNAVDDADIELDPRWAKSSATGKFVGTGYRHDGDAHKGELAATFRAPAGLGAGRYEVRVAYSPHPNRASNVPVTIAHAGGEASVTLDQRQPPAGGGGGGGAPFAGVGTFEFGADPSGSVTISNEGTDGHVIIDAVQWVPAEEE